MPGPLIQSRQILFDGACGFCKRTAKMVGYLDWLGKVTPRDFLRDWDTLKTEHPQLDMDACLRDMHVIRDDGVIHKGFDGYRSLAWVLPIWWIVLPLLYIPPIHWLGCKAYRYIADHRKRACELTH